MSAYPTKFGPEKKAPEKEHPLTTAWKTWKTTPSPENLLRAVELGQPTIETALTSYVGKSVPPSARGKAKLLAAEAVRTYDPEKGTKITTHLHNYLQPLIRYGRESRSAVHVPEETSSAIMKIKSAEGDLTAKLGRDPTDAELATNLGVSMRALGRYRRQAGGELAESVFDRGEGEDEASGDIATEFTDPLDVWAHAVYHDLDPVGKKIMEWKTGFNGHSVLPVNTIARRLGVSASAVSQRADVIAKRISQGLTYAK